MRRGIAALLACCLLAFAGACGESSEPSRHTTPAAETGTGTSSGPYVPSPTAPATPPRGAAEISYRNIAISPTRVRVKVGSVVVWTNYDSLEHNVTTTAGPQKFRSGLLSEGKSFEVQLNKPGVIDYECSIHPQSMKGSIEVVR